MPTAQAADTGNAAPQTGLIVSDEPGKNAPNILDGTVYSIAKVGNTIVVGGQFTQAQNYNTSTTLTRNNVLAFDATTGKLLTTFAPNPTDTVYKVLPAADGHSVYVAGSFTSAAGKSVPGRVFKIDVSTGVVDPTFVAPTISGTIRDLELVGNHLFIAGKFTHINGVAQKALGTLYADTGKRDPYFNNVFAGVRNSLAGAVTDVLQISINPQNTELVGVGNFTSVDGQSRSQIARLDIGNIPSGTNTSVHPSLSTWSTTLYTSPCAARFDTYLTDVEYSPDGGYFVVSSTGAYGGSAASNAGTSGCDVVARFEDNQVESSTPTWTAYTGSDSTWTVEVTDNVVYAGGHQRYQNNPGGNNTAGPGAVSLEGIAALNPVNGMPFSWNPTRARGVGVQDILATSDGLYVGSDTELIGHTPGNTYHARIAVLPLAGGKTLPQPQATTLPVEVYRVASGASQLTRRTFTGTTAGTATSVANGPGWSTSTGAFMVNGVLYKVNSDGTVAKMSFNGSSYGGSSPVNSADLLVVQSEWHTDAKTLTSLFYAGGRIYYTKSGTNALYRRGFEIEDDVVGQQRFSTTTTGIDWSTVRGAFVVGNKLYYANTAGALFSATWDQAANAPVAGTVTPLTAAGTGWASRAMFFYQAVPTPVNEPPVASASISCQQLVCSFDGSSSTDPEDGALSYDWNFGDGTAHATTATTTHTYADTGDRSVTLTVTDSEGATDAITKVASPTSQPDPVSFVNSNNKSGSFANHTITVPSGTQAGDTLLLFFAANSTAPVYTGPAGWTQVLSDSSSGEVGKLYVKKATASDLGASVLVTSRNTDGTTYTVKSDLTLASYRGNGAAPITASAISVQSVADIVHQTPTVTAPDGSSWLVSFWSDKGSTTIGWTGPTTQTLRSAGTATGTSHVSSLLMDSNGRVNSGLQGGLSATAEPSSSAQGLTMSILLSSQGAPPSNQAPTARITNVSCTGMTCSFSGASSSDPDNDPLSYSWDFGDTSFANNVAPSHTYSTTGAKTVTLTVDDDHGHTATDTTTVNPTADPVSHVVFVGASSSNGNRVTHATTLPAGVQVGDTLVAMFTANTVTPTYTGPSGWTSLESKNGDGITTQVWTRTATTADTATNAKVTVTSSGYAKSDLTVAVYRGTDATAPIAVSASKIDNTAGATHVSPAVNAPDDTGWLVTYWADKATNTTGWTAPAGQTVRQAATTTAGDGHITALLVDSNGPVPSGAEGQLTATANSASSRGASITLVLTSN